MHVGSSLHTSDCGVDLSWALVADEYIVPVRTLLDSDLDELEIDLEIGKGANIGEAWARNGGDI